MVGMSAAHKFEKGKFGIIDIITGNTDGPKLIVLVLALNKRPFGYQPTDLTLLVLIQH